MHLHSNVGRSNEQRNEYKKCRQLDGTFVRDWLLTARLVAGQSWLSSPAMPEHLPKLNQICQSQPGRRIKLFAPHNKMPSWIRRRILLRSLSSPKTNLKIKRTVLRRRLQQRIRKKNQRVPRPQLWIRKRSPHQTMIKKQLKTKNKPSRANHMRKRLQKTPRRSESWLKSSTKPSKISKQKRRSTRK